MYFDVYNIQSKTLILHPIRMQKYKHTHRNKKAYAVYTLRKKNKHTHRFTLPFLYDEAKISSTCSANPMSNIWSTSSRTTCFSFERSSLLFSMWSLMRPGVPTKISIPLRIASTRQKERRAQSHY